LHVYNDFICIEQLVTKSVVAALNIDYPAEKLNVYVCDDGKSPGKHCLVIITIIISTTTFYTY